MSRARINSFVLGDAFDDASGLFAFADNSVDHTLMDPPYNDHVHSGNRRGWETNTAGERVPTKSMEMKFGFWSEEDATVCASEVVRVTKGWALIFCALEDIGMWKRLLVDAGAKRRNTAIWTKSLAAPKFQGDGPANAAEAIVTAWCGKGKSIWNAGGSYGHYHYPIDTRDRRHETQKPLPLLRQLLLDFTMPNDIILDPTAGGGTTLIAAKQLGRRWIGYELGDTPESVRAHAKGLAELERAREQTHIQQLMLHKRRRDAAYAGSRLKQVAIQSSLDFNTRRGRSLDDLEPPRRRARSLDDL